jgi:hypothetical protein
MSIQAKEAMLCESGLKETKNPEPVQRKPREIPSVESFALGGKARETAERQRRRKCKSSRRLRSALKAIHTSILHAHADQRKAFTIKGGLEHTFLADFSRQLCCNNLSSDSVHWSGHISALPWIGCEVFDNFILVHFVLFPVVKMRWRS